MSPKVTFNFGHAIRSAVFSSVSFYCGLQYLNLTRNLSPTHVVAYGQPTLLAVGALAFAYFSAVELHWLLLRRDLPDGDLGIPFLGNTLKVFTDAHFYDRKEWLENKWFLAHVFFKPTLVATSDVEHQWIWAQERKGNVIGFWPGHWTELMGPRVVSTSHGTDHKRLRRWMEPAFLPETVHGYIEVLDQTTLTVLEEFAKLDEFQSTLVLRKFALRLLFVSVFQQEDEGRLTQLDRDIGIWFKGFMSVFPYNIPGTVFGNAKQARVRLMENIGTLVDEFESLVDTDPSKKDSLLGRLLFAKDDETGEPFLSREDLCANLNVLFFAGHDTTYATTSNLLYNLSAYPDSAKALKDEIDKLPQRLTFEALKPAAAPVLNAFIDETMRLEPVIGGSNKQPLVALERHGYKIPKSFVLAASLQATSRQCPEPETFALERHLPPDHPFVAAKTDRVLPKTKPFRPFGGGAHVCLGQHFAKLELKMTLIRIVQLYNVEVKNVEKINFPLRYYKSEFKLTPKSQELKV